jgi:hypothetical protein
MISFMALHTLGRTKKAFLGSFCLHFEAGSCPAGRCIVVSRYPCCMSALVATPFDQFKNTISSDKLVLPFSILISVFKLPNLKQAFFLFRWQSLARVFSHWNFTTPHRIVSYHRRSARARGIRKCPLCLFAPSSGTFERTLTPRARACTALCPSLARAREMRSPCKMARWSHWFLSTYSSRGVKASESTYES